MSAPAHPSGTGQSDQRAPQPAPATQDIDGLDRVAGTLDEVASRLKGLRPLVVTASALVVVLIGIADYRVDVAASMAIFYLIPVAITTLMTGFGGGAAIALFSATVNFTGDWLLFSRYPAISNYTAIWNACSRLAMYLIVVSLITVIRHQLARERRLARTDPNTGAANARALYERLTAEIASARSGGWPVTVVYLDLDNFKLVNDRHGHAAGNNLLGEVAKVAGAILRTTDVVARIGGDEFVLVIPGVDATVARATVERVVTGLKEASAAYGAPVTFSAGILTTGPTVLEPEELIQRADALMYEAKNGGKDRIVDAVV